MSFFNAYQLLRETAREYHHQRETFSTVEIAARINEIKYLSAQKKVPKISLRKEIVHLERQLSTIREVEQHLLNQKKHESAKVKSMKKQIGELQGRLAATEDKDMQQKLDRLSQLLGDYLAKKTTEEEVKAAIADIKLVKAEKGKPLITKSEKMQHKLSPLLAQERYGPSVQKGRISLFAPIESSPAPPAEIQEDMQPRIKGLQQRVELLKGELELLQILKKDARAQGVAEKITFLEQKLNEYWKRAEVPLEPVATKPEVVVEKPGIKHTLLFAPPFEKSTELMEEKSPQKMTDEELELEKELPLPPPPKMKK